jgi:uncharacterized membrane protein
MADGSRSFPWSVRGLAIGLALAAASQAWGLADRYTLTDLGPAGGAPAIATDDNRVIGYTYNADDPRNPTSRQFVPSPLNLDAVLGGGSSVYATAAGRIVGATEISGVSHAVVYTVATGTVRDLGQTLASEALDSTATTVTQEDVGGYANSPDQTRILPVLWIGSITPVYLDTLGGNSGFVEAMNDKGDAVGDSQTATGDTHCTFWPATGGMVDCHPPNWGTNSYGTAINAQGLFVGSALHWEGFVRTSRAFLGLPYGTVLLPPLPEDTDSVANGINSLGDIVGGSCRQAACRPTAWVNGVAVDLTPRIAGIQGWTHLAATGISEDGWIVGLGIPNGEYESHSLLFTPVDDATTAWYTWKYRISRWYQARYARWRKSIDWYYRDRARAAQR